MIILVISLIVCILGVGMAFAMVCPNHRKFTTQPWFRKMFCVVIALAIICAVSSSALFMSYRESVNDIHETYNSLNLYYNTVNNSSNEYVRFDYYEKAQSYNDWYARLCEHAESSLVGAFFPGDWDEGLDYINFNLHGDNYNG